jgi:hypothetical protein
LGSRAGYTCQKWSQQLRGDDRYQWIFHIGVHSSLCPRVSVDNVATNGRRHGRWGSLCQGCARVEIGRGRTVFPDAVSQRRGAHRGAPAVVNVLLSRPEVEWSRHFYFGMMEPRLWSMNGKPSNRSTDTPLWGCSAGSISWPAPRTARMRRRATTTTAARFARASIPATLSSTRYVTSGTRPSSAPLRSHSAARGVRGSISSRRPQ